MLISVVPAVSLFLFITHSLSLSLSKNSERKQNPASKNRVFLKEQVEPEEKERVFVALSFCNGKVKVQQQQEGLLHFSPITDNQLFVSHFSSIPPSLTQEVLQATLEVLQLQKPKAMVFPSLSLWLHWHVEVGLQSRPCDPISSISMCYK